jgi:hypothetical protein
MFVMLLIRQSTHIIAGKRLICQGARVYGVCFFKLHSDEKKAGKRLSGSKQYIGKT